MTTTSSTAVEHGITITEVTTPAGTPRRADCVCGWQSKLVPSNPIALAEGQAHVIGEATDHARHVRERVEADYTVSTNPGTHGMPVRMTQRAEPTLSTGLVECAPWCVYDDNRGHGGYRYREDQWCGTEELSVPLTGRREGRIRVSGLRRPDEAPEVEIDLEFGGDEVGTTMSLDDATQLAQALQVVLDQICADAGR